MRDLLLAIIIVVICISALRRPWIGVMGWTWISLMNPHALSWHLNLFPVAAAIAGCTLLGLLISKDRKNFSISSETGFLIAFMFWICITLIFSFDVEGSSAMWKRVIKIDFMILVSLVLLHSKKHLICYLWVVVASIGFYGVKGGVFTIITGGTYRVWGPTNTFIEGNNEIALALIIIAPLLYFLRSQVNSRWGKNAISLSILLCVAAALGSQSRGALVALIAMAIAFWWYGGRQFGILTAILIVSVVAWLSMPDEWFSRMNTIAEYQSDASAMGRINAWRMAWNLASDRFFGGGFDIYNPIIFSQYAPDPLDVHAAHSIYFQILGEHGFIGFLLFLILWSIVWWNAGKLRNNSRLSAETKWVSDLGAMCQVSILGYAVGGAFLSLAYFDLPYDVIVVVVLARRWLQEQLSLKKQQHVEHASVLSGAVKT